MISVGDCDIKPYQQKPVNSVDRKLIRNSVMFFFSQDHPGQGLHGTESRKESIQTGEDHCFCTVKIHTQNCIRTTKGR